MDIKKLVVGQLQTNCYLAIDRISKQCLIIDPGDDADYIQRIILDEGVKPGGIIATHGHFDHILAATELQLNYRLPLWIHPKDIFLVRRMRETARHFIGITSGPPPNITRSLKAGQKIPVGEANLLVIDTPGHTPGSITLYSKKEKLAFVGDLIFSDGGVGRTDFSYSSFGALQKSITKILRLPSETVLLCGHGPETTVAAQRPFHKN